VGEGRNLAGEGRVRETKLPGGMGMGTNMCSRAGTCIKLLVTA